MKVLLVFAAIIAVGSCQMMCAGCPTLQDKDDPDLNEKLLNSTGLQSNGFNVDSIQTQVVAGVQYIYNITMASGRHCQVIILEQKWLNVERVTKNTCELMVSKKQLGGWRPVTSTTDSLYQTAMHCMMDRVNGMSNSMYKMVPLTMMMQPTQQVVRGIQYHMKYKVQESTCLKSVTGYDTCLVKSNSIMQPMIAEAIVWMDPTSSSRCTITDFKLTRPEEDTAKQIGGDDHDYKPHGNNLIGRGDHDYMPHGNGMMMGGDNHGNRKLMSDGDRNKMPPDNGMMMDGDYMGDMMGGDNHGYMKHGRNMMGGDNHDYMKHGDNMIGGDDHDYMKHGDNMIGGDNHDYMKHGDNMIGGDNHDYMKHGENMIGGDDHDYVKHGENMIGGDDHDYVKHGDNVIGGDDHDYVKHGDNMIGGDDHDYVKHGDNMIGGDDHDYVKHGDNMIGGDDHDYVKHGGNMIGGDDHDYVKHGGNMIGGDDHDYVPHGDGIMTDDKTPDQEPAGPEQGMNDDDLQSLLGGDDNDDCRNDMFIDFMRRHNKQYLSQKEKIFRYSTFCDNMLRVKKLRFIEKGTARYGATKFADLTEAEFKQYVGRTWDQSANDWMKRADIPKGAVPASFDWREHGAVTPVKNQGSCGSCWAFSTTGNIEGQWAIQKKKLISLSEQELVDCDKLDDGCEGGLPSNAYKEIERLGGLETEAEYQYKGEDEKCEFIKKDVKVYINDSLSISSNETEMVSWLAANGPISIGINAFAMQFYMGGISYPWKFFCNPADLDHGVLIVGYDVEKSSKKPYWIVKNSWGPDWGEKGYYLVYRGAGVCGLNTMCTSAVVN